MKFEPKVISRKINRNRKIRKILFSIVYIMLIPIILFSLFLILLELGNSGEVPSFLNFELYNVVSESMEPKLKIGDIIVVKKGIPENKYKKRKYNNI